MYEIMSKVIWPEVITNPDFEYSGERIRERAIADGLCAWGCCSMGKLPENFGKGMVKISTIVGSASPDYLEKEADKILKP